MDALHDNSHRIWLSIANAHESLIPAYVMEASLLEKSAAADLPDRNFADTVGRMFPLDSRADVWLSAAYFAKAAEAYKPVMRAHVEANIMKAAEVFGIEGDCRTITDALRAPVAEKQASDDSWGWVEKSASGAVIDRLYPMFDAEGVKLASDFFTENRDKYPLLMRRTIAKNIQEKAASFGVEVSSEVRREAGSGMPRRDTLMSEIIDRSHLVKDAELAVALLNLNELVATQSMDELAPQLEKIAEVIEAIDETEGLHRHYGKKVLAPADFIFDIDMKEAAAMSEDTVELHKYQFSIHKLAGLDPKVYEDVLGEDFAGRISRDGKVDGVKLADELNSMTSPDRQALERHLETVFGD